VRIAFAIGGAEPGRDGIGDYTRRLAGELVGRGVEACVVALNDTSARTQAVEMQRGDARDVPVLRLPASLDWDARIAAADAWLAERKVDRLVFCFASTQYERRGMMRRPAPGLLRLAQGRRPAAILHETWLGDEDGASIKHRLLGLLQRRSIVDFLRALAPAPFYATNHLYRLALERHGLAAQVLPLFGNMPPAGPHDGEPWFWAALREQGVGVDADSRGRFWLMGWFGSIYHGTPFEELFAPLAAAARETRRRIVMLSIGRQGEGADDWERWRATYGQRADFAALGERPPQQVAEALAGLDFGVAASPLAMIGKSGTAAAFVELGLPTVVSRDDHHYRYMPDRRLDLPANFMTLDGDLTRKLLAAGRAAPVPRLAQAADRLLADLA
jgi:hypothetical protein